MSLPSLSFSFYPLRTSLRRGHVRNLARPALDDQVRGLADRAGLLRVRQRRARVGRLEVDVVVLLVRLFSFFLGIQWWEGERERERTSKGAVR